MDEQVPDDRVIEMAIERLISDKGAADRLIAFLAEHKDSDDSSIREFATRWHGVLVGSEHEAELWANVVACLKEANAIARQAIDTARAAIDQVSAVFEEAMAAVTSMWDALGEMEEE